MDARNKSLFQKKRHNLHWVWSDKTVEATTDAKLTTKFRRNNNGDGVVCFCFCCFCFSTGQGQTPHIPAKRKRSHAAHFGMIHAFIDIDTGIDRNS